MNIKHVEICDFRKSEATNLESILKIHPSLRKLNRRDIIMLINLARTQIIMILGFYDISANITYIRSEKIRLLGGEKWDPFRFAKYGNQVGVALTGFELLQNTLGQLRQEMEEVKLQWRMAS